MVAKARRSGIVVTPEMVPLIRGMIIRGDRKHDICAWFGLNPARIKETTDGWYGAATPAPENELPPAGSPGPRATELRGAVNHAIQTLHNGRAGAAAQALARLRKAAADFDQDV
jgi:hypothetical protein